MSSWKTGQDRLAALGVCFAYALKAHLTQADDDKLRGELATVAGVDAANDVVSDSNRPHAVARAMTVAAAVELAPPLQARVDARISHLLDLVGHVDRITEPLVPHLVAERARQLLTRAAFFLAPCALLGLGAGFFQVVFGSAFALVILRRIDTFAAGLKPPFDPLDLDAFCAGLKDEYETTIRGQS